MASETRTLLIEPHNDDAVLFASWTLLRHRPHVITVLRSVVQEANGIYAGERENESWRALVELGFDPASAGSGGWTQWKFLDDDPPWPLIRRMLLDVEALSQPDVVFAPWPDEPGGHDHHRKIGALAFNVFGAERVRCYCTYRVGGPKTTGTLVEYEREWIPRKLRALACFRSQIERGPHRFFVMGLDEYTP